MKEKSSGNQSLIRGLHLLDILSQFPNGCPLAKLTELSGLNKSTVHRLLQGLQQAGFVKVANSLGSYRLTTKCLGIGQKILSSLNIVNLAAPYLEKINLSLGETVNFSKREDDYSVLIYKLEPTTGMMKTRAYIGQHQQFFCSAMGKIYLAYEKNPHYLQDYWIKKKEKILPLTANTITEISLMQKEITEILKNGFALDKEESELGVMCVAVPVFSQSGKVEHAISVSLSTPRFNQIGITTLVAQIKEAAIFISKELGWEE